MSFSVIDEGANRDKLIQHAITIIGKSKDRLAVFVAIYDGKQAIKSQEFIKKHAGLPNTKRVLEEGKKLVTEKIVIPVKENGIIAYKKIDFYSKNKSRIISTVQKNILGTNKTILKSQDDHKVDVRIRITGDKSKSKEITADDIDSFSKISKIRNVKVKRYPESEIKKLLQNILNEKGKFTDWGGEINDIHTTRLVINGKRISSAFALKGSGTKPPLTIKKMGTNGDQISRLFKSPARVFFVQFDGQIDQSILDLMKELAENKGRREGKMMYYGIIDGTDTQRLFDAYT